MSSNTKNVIIDAFLELLNTKDFSKISITDITEKCDASRQTFYYHFDNIDAMLKWAFDEQTKKACSKITKGASWRDSIDSYTDFLNKYVRLFQCAIQGDSSLMVLDLLKNSYYTFYRKYLLDNTNLSIVREDDFFVNCCAATMLCYVIEESRKVKPDFDKMNNELHAHIKKYGLAK